MSMLALSGWAQPSDAVARAVAADALTFDYSDYDSLDAVFPKLSAFSDVEHVIGWSLGGQLALRAIAAGVLKPKRVTLLAVPYQFLRSEQVPQAMDAFTYQTFRDNYAHDPQRTAGRFHALVAKGDQKAKAVMAQLDHHPQVTDTARWLPWFDALGADGLHGLNLSNVPPTTIVHGTEDAIVPIAQASMLAEALPNATLHRWEGVAHAPHLHDAGQLAGWMHAWSAA